MIVRHLDEVRGGPHDVTGPGWNSRRLLTAPDGMGYTMTDTLIEAGAEMELQYTRHLEACYCVEGAGDITDLASGQTHPISVGTIYALNGHDRHRVRSPKGMRLICCFTPALTGLEVHGADGSY